MYMAEDYHSHCGVTVRVLIGADTQLEADLDRAQKEIEQLKTDHDVAIERKDREVSSSSSVWVDK